MIDAKAFNDLVALGMHVGLVGGAIVLILMALMLFRADRSRTVDG
jgi:hypothetical protein